MRLFIAVDIPEEIKDYLVTIRNKISSDFAKIRWVTKEQMHITLKFLGEVAETNLNKIRTCLNSVQYTKFDVKLSNIGVFPTENYIRVIWVGLEPKDKIISLQQKVDYSLKDLFKRERDFKVHLTLARVKFVKDKKKLSEVLKSLKIDDLTFTVNNFKLMKSTLTPKGPIYEELALYKSQDL